MKLTLLKASSTRPCQKSRVDEPLHYISIVPNNVADLICVQLTLFYAVELQSETLLPRSSMILLLKPSNITQLSYEITILLNQKYLFSYVNRFNKYFNILS